MEYRSLEINVRYAKDLNKVNLISKMDVYVVVSIEGDHQKHKQKTNVDKDGDADPSWNCPMKFTVDDVALQQNRLSLVFTVRCDRALGDKDIGEVHIPLKELFDSVGEGKQQQSSYQVRKPSGKPKGELTFSYKFGEKSAQLAAVAKPLDEPVTAYPAYPVAASSSAYPPAPYARVPGAAYPQSAGGYPPHGAPAAAGGYAYPPPQYGGYPPQQPHPGYGYPPQAGYGYPPVQQQPPKKNKFGLGLGAGLLGGAIGGLLIGDMVSDAASYDAGFEDGFDAGF